MKKLLICLLLTLSCWAQQLQARYGEYDHHRYIHFRCDGPLDLLTEWPKGYVQRVKPNELLLRLPDDLLFVPELTWKTGTVIFTTHAFEIPELELPQ